MKKLFLKTTYKIKIYWYAYIYIFDKNLNFVFVHNALVSCL